MPDNWTTYRLLCVVSPDLETERASIDAANVAFAERVTMPAHVLFALASPRDDFDPRFNRRALESNIRFCDFFVQIFSETAPDPAFTVFVDLAAACTVDPAFPMRSTVVLFRNPEKADPGMASLRRRLLDEGRCIVCDYHDSAELDAVAAEVLASWYALVHDQHNAASPA